MSAHSHVVRLRCTAIMLLVTLPGVACQGWHTEDFAPQAVLATQQPTQLRVTRTDNAKPLELRAYLRTRTSTLSETWSYVLPPD